MTLTELEKSRQLHRHLAYINYKTTSNLRYSIYNQVNVVVIHSITCSFLDNHLTCVVDTNTRARIHLHPILLLQFYSIFIILANMRISSIETYCDQFSRHTNKFLLDPLFLYWFEEEEKISVDNLDGVHSYMFIISNELKHTNMYIHTCIVYCHSVARQQADHSTLSNWKLPPTIRGSYQFLFKFYCFEFSGSDIPLWIYIRFYTWAYSNITAVLKFT